MAEPDLTVTASSGSVSGAVRIHGGPNGNELAGLGIGPEQLIDFSVNTNPYGPDPAVIIAARRAVLDRYPDPTATSTRTKMAPLVGAKSPEHILLGNGAADLLWATARALLAPTETALIAAPTFAEFGAAAVAAHARIALVWSHASQQFSMDLQALSAHAQRTRAKAVYLCTPNTPTGATIAADDIACFAAAHPDLFFVLDQSFLSLSDRATDLATAMPPNVLRIRSLTKDHALPGIRVGYLLAEPDLVARIQAQQPAWATSAMAQAAALAACQRSQFVDESRRRILLDRDRMIGQLERFEGLEVFPSSGPFVLVGLTKRGNAPSAAALRRQLLVRHHIMVRDCTSFGLPQCIRLASRPAADCDHLLQALGELLA